MYCGYMMWMTSPMLWTAYPSLLSTTSVCVIHNTCFGIHNTCFRIHNMSPQHVIHNMSLVTHNVYPQHRGQHMLWRRHHVLWMHVVDNIVYVVDNVLSTTLIFHPQHNHVVHNITYVVDDNHHVITCYPQLMSTTHKCIHNIYTQYIHTDILWIHVVDNINFNCGLHILWSTSTFTDEHKIVSKKRKKSRVSELCVRERLGRKHNDSWGCG